MTERLPVSEPPQDRRLSEPAGRDHQPAWGWGPRGLWVLLALVLLLRVLTLGLYPLTDTTEARYAEMARKMLESGNWLTPMFDVGVPFWGKPPLSFWLSALPMALGGVGEFTARLGPLIAALGTLTLFWHWPRSVAHRDTQQTATTTRANNAIAISASIVFLSTPLGFIASAAVMTDMAMVAGTSLSMVAFWRAWTSAHGARGVWPWLFFAGQAIGLLAKGPVAVVLTGVALSLFLLIGVWRQGLASTLQHLWRALPWLRGLALTALLVLPWYLLAEQAWPGFLRYFIVGEHWYRFTQSGWKGDLYGVAHAQPKGRIWLFALIATLPWALAALWWALKRWRQNVARAAAFTSPGERDYLLCWAVAPCVFFTLSGNILPAYALPGLPAFALLVATLWNAAADAPHPSAASARLQVIGTGLAALLTPLAFTALVLLAPERFDAFSDKALLRGVPPAQVVYLVQRPASGVFYSRGQARLVAPSAGAPPPVLPDAVPQALTDPGVQRLILPHRQLANWQAALQANGWTELARNSQMAAFGRQRPSP